MKGVERFNYDNFIVIMTIESDKSAHVFDEPPIQNKIGFYWKGLGLDSIICLKEWYDPKTRRKFNYCFSGMVNRVADEADGIRAIDWMKALLHKNDYRRLG